MYPQPFASGPAAWSSSHPTAASAAAPAAQQPSPASADTSAFLHSSNQLIAPSAQPSHAGWQPYAPAYPPARPPHRPATAHAPSREQREWGDARQAASESTAWNGSGSVTQIRATPPSSSLYPHAQPDYSFAAAVPAPPMRPQSANSFTPRPPATASGYSLSLAQQATSYNPFAPGSHTQPGFTPQPPPADARSFARPASARVSTYAASSPYAPAASAQYSGSSSGPATARNASYNPITNPSPASRSTAVPGGAVFAMPAMPHAPLSVAGTPAAAAAVASPFSMTRGPSAPHSFAHRSPARYMHRPYDSAGLFHPVNDGARPVDHLARTVEWRLEEGRDGWVPARGAHPDGPLRNVARTFAKRVAKQRAQSAHASRRARAAAAATEAGASEAEPPLPLPLHPSLLTARQAVLSYFASPACMLFSSARQIIAVSDADLDLLVRKNTDPSVGDRAAKDIVQLLQDMDVEGKRFGSFEELLEESRMRRGWNGVEIPHDDETHQHQQQDDDRQQHNLFDDSPPRPHSARNATPAASAEPRSLSIVSERSKALFRAAHDAEKSAWRRHAEAREAKARRERLKVVEARAAAKAAKAAQDEAAAQELARAEKEKQRKAAAEARTRAEAEAERLLAVRAEKLAKVEADKKRAREAAARKDAAEKAHFAKLKKQIAEAKRAKEAQEKAERRAKMLGDPAPAPAPADGKKSVHTPPPERADELKGKSDATSSVQQTPGVHHQPPKHHFSNEGSEQAQESKPAAAVTEGEAEKTGAAEGSAKPTADDDGGGDEEDEYSSSFTLVHNGPGDDDDEGEYVSTAEAKKRQQEKAEPANSAADEKKSNGAVGADPKPASATDVAKPADEAKADPPSTIQPPSTESDSTPAASKPAESTKPAAAPAAAPAAPKPAAAATSKAAMCDQCFSAPATLSCVECEENMCAACNDEVHTSASMLKHTRKPVGAGAEDAAKPAATETAPAPAAAASAKSDDKAVDAAEKATAESKKSDAASTTMKPASPAPESKPDASAESKSKAAEAAVSSEVAEPSSVAASEPAAPATPSVAEAQPPGKPSAAATPSVTDVSASAAAPQSGKPSGQLWRSFTPDRLASIESARAKARASPLELLAGTLYGLDCPACTKPNLLTVAKCTSCSFPLEPADTVQHSDNIFLDLINGKDIGTKIVARGDDYLIFNDKFPISPLHVDVIPLTVYRDITVLDSSHIALVERLFSLGRDELFSRGPFDWLPPGQELGDLLVAGFNFPVSVPHLHLHVLLPPFAHESVFAYPRWHSLAKVLGDLRAHGRVRTYTEEPNEAEAKKEHARAMENSRKVTRWMAKAAARKSNAAAATAVAEAAGDSAAASSETAAPPAAAPAAATSAGASAKPAEPAEPSEVTTSAPAAAKPSAAARPASASRRSRSQRSRRGSQKSDLGDLDLGGDLDDDLDAM